MHSRSKDKMTELLVASAFPELCFISAFWRQPEAVLGMNLLQGLLKLKVAACWQNVMYYRRIADKPDV